MRSATKAAILCFGVFAFAACGGDDDGGGRKTPAAATASPTAAAATRTATAPPSATASPLPPSPSATFTPSPTPSVTPTTAPLPDLTVATLNVLHGLTCPSETEFCRAVDRMGLFIDWVVASGCPDVVTVQEIIGAQVMEPIALGAAEACPFSYTIVTSDLGQNLILSRFPVLASRTGRLLGSIRLVLHARIDHPLGPVDVFTTHLAAGVDGGPQPCTEPCPQECVAAGAVSNRDCQAVQLAAFVAAEHDAGTPAVVTGDFNSPPGSFVYRYLDAQGWIDSYLAAGNPECDPATGVGCTCCRNDEELSELESPESNTRERVDYAFAVPAGTASCSLEIDSGDDADGDGVPTRIFADEPNPFAESCGPRPLPVCWPSDHEGMIVDVNCGPSAGRVRPATAASGRRSAPAG